VSVLPQVVTRNWRLKLAAFALSLFLWAVVTLQPRDRQIMAAVPVEVLVNDPSWSLSEVSPSTVSVHLGGSARELLQFSPDGTAVVRVPIESITTPDTIVRLRSDWVFMDEASTLVVENLTPATVTLHFERAQATALPLSVRTRNDFPDGLALAQPLAPTPGVIRVRGPARLIEDLDSIPLEALDLSTVTESGLHSVEVDTTGLGNLNVDPNSATVAVLLEPAVERVISEVPVVVIPPFGIDPSSLTTSPAVILVTLRGAQTLVDQADPLALQAVVVADQLETLAPGSDQVAQIRIRGVPSLVRAFSAVDTVRVRRAVPPAEPLAPAVPPGEDSVAPTGGPTP